MLILRCRKKVSLSSVQLHGFLAGTFLVRVFISHRKISSRLNPPERSIQTYGKWPIADYAPCATFYCGCPAES
jgi:hypothetical protein